MKKDKSEDAFRSEVNYKRPPLVKLTQIGGHPEIDGGAPTTAYVDPTIIALVVRGFGGFKMPGEKESTVNTSHTCIWLQGGHHLLVLETPEVVALRRDRALNNEVQLEDA